MMGDLCPETRANILSRITFHWVQPLFSRASNLQKKEGKAIEFADLLQSNPVDGSRLSSSIFEDSLEKKGSVRRAVQAVMGRKFIIAGLIKIVNTCLQFLFPILLNLILEFIEEAQAQEQAQQGSAQDEENVVVWYVKYRGYWLSAILFIVMTLRTCTENAYFHLVYRAGFQTRAAVSASVYNKALRITCSERHGQTLGELVNLMQVDATKVESFISTLHTLWDGLLQIVGYMTILYFLIGWPCFIGLILMIFSAPVQLFIMKRLFGLNRGMVKFTDARVKTANEAIQGIRCVKMYTWEEAFQKLLNSERKKELDYLGNIAYLRAFSRAYMDALPSLVAVVSFVTYATVGRKIIEASTLFAALVAFDLLRFPLLFYPMSLAQLAQALVSIERLEKFFKLKEIQRDDLNSTNLNNDMRVGEIAVSNATIYWRDPNEPIQIHNNTYQDGDSNKRNNSKQTKKNLDSQEIPLNEEEFTYAKPILKDINLNIESGIICAIVGRVGTGKSTLCSAILNETVVASGGSVALHGKVAYAAQTPWILNATLRDNITFGKPFEQKKYDEILTACQLDHDLSLFKMGDLTEIGENGINLSGGQRQRVSIARAAYADADIIILDDPLSALDPEVGKKLFDECIVRIMKNRTRIFVTNQLQYLKFCEHIIVLGNGNIVEQDSFDNLSKNNGSQLQRILEEFNSSKNKDATSSEESLEGTVKSSLSEDKAQPHGKEQKSAISEEDSKAGLVKDEERNMGAVSWRIYQKYIQAGGGYLRFSIPFTMFILTSANTLLYTLWVTFWTSDANYEKHTRSFYLGYYALISISLGFFAFFRSYSIAKFGVHASNCLHGNLLRSVLKAPMSFYDTTPTGRILSRFSKDLYSIDVELTEMCDFFFLCVFTVGITFITVTFVTPYFGITLIPITYFYVKVLNYFRAVSRETKRLESISRSPIFAHFSETLGGLETIRAYDQGDRFTSEFVDKVDANTRAYYNNKVADRWVSLRLEFLGASIAGIAATLASNVVIENSVSGATTTSNFASFAGLSLSYSISVTSLLNWLVRSYASMEASMNSAERILYYTENIPQEAPGKSKELKNLATKDDFDDDHIPEFPSEIAIKAMGIENPDPDWPSQGDIVIKDLKMRYRSETPLVIKGLNLNIKGGERVGVVGRTGSGKSSLMLALLRIVEPSILSDGKKYKHAPITIDGLDILRIGLTDLRSKIGILPQNPVLFSGTIRTNMDPFNEYSDDQIWNALDRCKMKEFIESNMPEGLLNGPVSEYGENLSQGQRQLLCLGRALLRKCRILLLDEATSSLDYETDANIQRTLRQEFLNCTILTVAHRVNTIMDSDKILVMKDGKAAEFASPQELLSDKSSLFYDIVKHSTSERHS